MLVYTRPGDLGDLLSFKDIMLDMLFVFEGMFQKSSLNFDLLLGVLWSEIDGLSDNILVQGLV